jgi:hypothetical protein
MDHPSQSLFATLPVTSLPSEVIGDFRISARRRFRRQFFFNAGGMSDRGA